MLAMAGLHANAQTARTSVSAGFELGLPSQSAYKTGVGAALKAETRISGPVAISVTGGISSFGQKVLPTQNAVDLPAVKFIPLKAGARYYSGNFFLEGEAGAAIKTNYDKNTLFAFSIGPGFFIPFDESKQGIEFGIRYENWGNQVKQTGIRIAYRIGW